MLLDEIITLLSDEKSGSLTSALLKIKILLHQIGKKELAEWVNWELNGYPKDVALPEYRILNSQVIANFCNIAYQVSKHPIPIGHLKPEMQESLQKAKMYESLAVLEDMASKKSGYLSRPIPMEANSLLSKGLANDYHVQSAWCSTPLHEVKGIITQVRSRLLDFILELKEQLNIAGDEENIKEKAATVDTTGIFNHSIFGANTTIGGNTTIVIGNHNNQTVQNGINTGDLNGLIETLKNIGIPAKEIETLKTAIDDDEKATGKASFIGKTGKWLNGFMSQIAEGSAKLASKDIAGAVVNAITSYISSS